MRFPSGGPFLEFNFYWADLSEVDALLRLVGALVGVGAQFRRGGIAYRAEAVADAATSGKDFEFTIADLSDLEDLLTNPLVRVERIYMEGATGTTHGVAEIITYLSIGQEEQPSKPRAIAIWTEGHWTESWMQATPAGDQQARTMGARARKRFCALVTATEPSYAALTVEEPLPTPTQLRRDGPGYAFHDFYVRGAYVGQRALDTMRRLYEDALVEPVGAGLYISCTPYFNPRHKSARADGQGRADQVARLLARGNA